MATQTQYEQLPRLDNSILAEASRPSLTKVTYLSSAPGKEPTSTVANRIFWAYVLIVLLIILHFSVPVEIQQQYYLDKIYKALGVVSLAYIAYLSITKDMC